MPREMLKLRKGDSAIMIKADGSVEMAGVNDKPLMDEKGMMSPVILFAAAWAKKDKNLFDHMINNFKNCVREGYFGPEAQKDLKQIEFAAASGAVTTTASGAVTTTASGTVAATMGGEQVNVKPTLTPEEQARKDEQERVLHGIVERGQDPRVLRQTEALKKGARSLKSKPLSDGLPDLPVEKTMKYQEATPEEQEQMKKEQVESGKPIMSKQQQLDLLNASGAKTPEEAAKVLNSINEEQTVGNVTIEENKDNEDQ